MRKLSQALGKMEKKETSGTEVVANTGRCSCCTAFCSARGRGVVILPLWWVEDGKSYFEELWFCDQECMQNWREDNDSDVRAPERKVSFKVES